MKTSHILGLNARSQKFTFKENSKDGKRIAMSKIRTARALKHLTIPTPRIYKKFFKPQDIMNFNWDKLPASFALKPSKGLGGGGIIVVKKCAKDRSYWITTQKEKVTADDLKLHVLDILEGAFSIGNVPDSAFIQEYVGRHKAFQKYAYRGTPDIRIIVFNKVPVMAMLRLPTKESGGRANLHQGAIGVGIDMATGITTKAVWHGKLIKEKPDSALKLAGLQIPEWDKILETAARTSQIEGLGYMGVDIVLHPEKGPMVLEVNSQPGLQIQLANQSGLKKRLERVEDLEVANYEQGIRISKALFSDKHVVKRKEPEIVKTLSIWENVKIRDNKGRVHEFVAKIDTGAWRTSIDRKLAKKLGLVNAKTILWSKIVRSGLGREKREVINLTLYLGGKKIPTVVSLANRQNLRTPVIVGRRDLEGFLVRTNVEGKNSSWVPQMWKS